MKIYVAQWGPNGEVLAVSARLEKAKAACERERTLEWTKFRVGYWEAQTKAGAYFITSWEVAP
jgi:hypothetical protein